MGFNLAFEGLMRLELLSGQQLRTHIQTEGNDVRPDTVQTHNERTSTEYNLVTAQSTAHEPPEDEFRVCGSVHLQSLKTPN